MNFVDVTGGRIENVISDENRYGIVVSGGRDNAVVNCTVARNSSLGLSFPSGDGTLAFNNCIADCATGVFLGEAARGVAPRPQPLLRALRRQDGGPARPQDAR